jgi:error-prone DNA polymerase
VLPIAPPEAPRLRRLGRWQELVADYATSGVTVGDHVMAALRPRLNIPMLSTSAQLERMPHGCSVTIAGLVIARQRPGTAKGIVFLLFEDEWGTVNLIVPPDVYERQRSYVRTEPLLLARGKLERPEAGGGVINVLVREVAPLDASLADEVQAPDTAADTHELRPVGSSMRAVAPAVQSFASGRRR